MLHFAPEAAIGKPLQRFAEIDYTSGDLRPGAAMEVMDITSIPRPDASFDVVLCNHVLEHIPDDSKAMAEIYRVLRPGGCAYMQHPIDPARAETFEDPTITSPADRLRLFGQEDHVRWYGRDFSSRLESAGFAVTERRYEDELSEETRLRTRPYAAALEGPRGGDIYVCIKPN